MGKVVTAKELHSKVSSILREVKHGREILISYRGKEIAVLKPVDKKAGKEFNSVGFGMWKERQELKDIDKWVEERRGLRFSK